MTTFHKQESEQVIIKDMHSENSRYKPILNSIITVYLF